VLVVALLVWRFWWAPIPPRLAGVVTAGAAYWLLTGGVRSSGAIVPQDPDQSRYVYLGVIILLLALAEAARGWRPGRRGLIALGALTALGVAQGLPVLREEAFQWRSASQRVQAEATALHAVRDRIPPDFEIADGLGDLQAARYFRAAEKFGSIALPIGELKDEPGYARHFADPVFIAGDVRLAAAGPAETARQSPPPAPVVEAPPGSYLSVDGCIDHDGPLDLRPESQALLIRAAAGATIELRRFGDSFHRAGTVPARAAWVLRILPDGAEMPWHVRVTVPPGPKLSVCSLG
jgi:hypothetical protein